MKKLLIAVASGALLFCGSALAKTAEIAAKVVQAQHPQVKPVTKGQNATAVFMNLVNNGSKSHMLIAALSPVAKETQLHKTIKIDGQPTMRQVSRIKIKAHKERDLHQGGFHVMLIGLQEALKPGQEVPLTLVFADGSNLNLKATVDANRQHG